ncbi:MAG: STAS domain-containing protein [Ignavibacteriaceae bacterium]
MGILSYFTTEVINDVFIVTVDLQQATIEQAGEFNKLLSDAIDKGRRKILIEMGEVEFMDSTFLGALIINLKKIGSSNGKFLLAGLKPDVKTMVQQTNLNKIFDVFESRTEALNSIQ